MLRLPIDRIKKVLDCLEGELLEVGGDGVSEFRLGVSFPLRVCLTLPIANGNIYYLYLMDVLGPRIIGHRVEVSYIRPRYVGCKYLSFSGNCGTYVGCFISDGIYKEVTEPTLRLIEFEEFIPSFIRNYEVGSQYLYETWVLDYLGMVKLLGKVWETSTFTSEERRRNREERYRLIREIRAHIDSYGIKTKDRSD